MNTCLQQYCDTLDPTVIKRNGVVFSGLKAIVFEKAINYERNLHLLICFGLNFETAILKESPQIYVFNSTLEVQTQRARLYKH